MICGEEFINLSEKCARALGQISTKTGIRKRVLLSISVRLKLYIFSLAMFSFLDSLKRDFIVSKLRISYDQVTSISLCCRV